MTEPEKKHPRRTRWIARILIIVLVALAVVYLRFGCRGYGFGPGGIEPVGVEPRPTQPEPVRPLVSADPQGSGSGSAGESPRCQLRLDSSGLWLSNASGQARADVSAAVTMCKEAGGAEVVVTGEAKQGAWDELRGALDAAGVPVFVRGGGATTGGATEATPAAPPPPEPAAPATPAPAQ